jgi:hypothetical protein
MECISKVKKTWRLNFLPLPSTRRFELTCKKGEKKTTLGCGGGGVSKEIRGKNLVHPKSSSAFH